MGLDDFKNKPALTARRKQRREREKDSFLAGLFEGFDNVDLGEAFDNFAAAIRRRGDMITRRDIPPVNEVPPFRPEDERPYPD